MELELQPGEQIIKKGRANHFEGPIGMIGFLYLTNQRLCFLTHSLNFKRYNFSVALDDIRIVRPQNNFGIFTHGLVVELTNNEVHRFAVWKRKQWLKEIHAVCGK